MPFDLATPVALGVRKNPQRFVIARHVRDEAWIYFTCHEDEGRHWASFFDADEAIACLTGATALPGPCVEFGCGYGPFTLPVARRAGDGATALDIDPHMVECVRRKATDVALHNIRAEMRDFVEQGTGLDDESQAHAMVYNLLHLEQPVELPNRPDRVNRGNATAILGDWADRPMCGTKWRTDPSCPIQPVSSAPPGVLGSGCAQARLGRHRGTVDRQRVRRRQPVRERALLDAGPRG